MPASTITARLGIEPDDVSIRGARRAQPVPERRIWAVEWRRPRLAVDEQAARVLARIRPVAKSSARLPLVKSRPFYRSFGTSTAKARKVAIWRDR